MLVSLRVINIDRGSWSCREIATSQSSIHLDWSAHEAPQKVVGACHMQVSSTRQAPDQRHGTPLAVSFAQRLHTTQSVISHASTPAPVSLHEYHWSSQSTDCTQSTSSQCVLEPLRRRQSPLNGGRNRLTLPQAPCAWTAGCEAYSYRHQYCSASYSRIQYCGADA